MQAEAATVMRKHAGEAEALRRELGTVRAWLAAAETARAHAVEAAAQASAAHGTGPSLKVRADA